MSRELAAARAPTEIAAVAVRHLHDIFEARVAVLVESAEKRLTNIAAGDGAFPTDEDDRSVAEWVWSHDKPAGMSTDTLPSARALYLPLRGTQGGVGVLGVTPKDVRRVVEVEHRALLELFANQIASALERAQRAERA
jgi:two-component system sensor histidine kinase KdpD